MTKTYTPESPPTRGNAKKAWDYFRRKYPNRPVREMYYSPSCDGVRAWVCSYQVFTSDLLHAGSGYSDWWVHWIPCSNLRWE